MDRATTSSSKKQLGYALIWLITTLSLMASLNFLGVSQAAGDSRNFDGTAPPDFALTTVTVDDATDPGALYGGALWTVNETRVKAGSGVLSRAVVEVDVTVVNTLTRTQLRIPDGMVTLADSSGRVATGVRFVDEGSLVSVEPGESVSLTLQFEVGFSQNPPAEELSLVISEQNRVPATIPLVGTGISDVTVAQAAIGTEPAELADPDQPARRVVVEPRSVVISINAGPYRAEVGERLAVVTVDVQRSSPDGELLYDTSFWGLMADEVLYAPVVVAHSGQPSVNTDEITMLFSFPETASGLGLVAGGTDVEGVQLPIVIPH